MTITIRAYDPARDRETFEALNAELQEYERTLRPSRRPGAEVAKEITALIEARLEEAGEAGAVLFAEADGRVVGFVACKEEDDPLELERREVRVHDLLVVEGERGKGVGQALLEAARSFASERGVERLTVSVVANNANAIAAYERFGFAVTYHTMEREV